VPRYILILGILAVSAWVGSVGYGPLTTPNRRWKLPNGDTIEVLTFDNYYQGSYSLMGRGVTGAHYLRLRFRSTLADAARDAAEVSAAAEVLCPIADSSGISQLLIQPTRASFFDLLTVSRNHVFHVEAGPHCDEIRRSN